MCTCPPQFATATNHSCGAACLSAWTRHWKSVPRDELWSCWRLELALTRRSHEALMAPTAGQFASCASL
eukprot:scaffold114783_cov69-Phaeocystis_antarctica.AAC.6